MASRRHRVVIVGGGFAGLNAAKALKKAPVDLTVIDRRNHHLFQPLLYQVATGGLSPANISAPIRALLSKQKNTRVLLAEVSDIDVEGRRVLLTDGEVGYDTLVVASGATHSYFGQDQWRDVAPGLKTLDDATKIRSHILTAFEAAERAKSEDERRAWLTFVIVGGGATGAEMAGALGELAKFTLTNDFRAFDSAEAKIYLIEAGQRVLGTFEPDLSAKAATSLEKLGVTVLTGSLVTEITPERVAYKTADGPLHEIAARTHLWTAGVQASPLGRMIAEATGAEHDRAGRVVVEPDLTVKNHPEIFIVGDLASYAHQTGKPLRGTADVAISEGAYVGKTIARRLAGKPVKPYHFRDIGTLAVIGRSAAVVDLHFIRLKGHIAWWFWLFVHLLKLVGFQNRLTVLVQWSWAYFTRKRSSRLITGPFKSPLETR